MKFNKLFAVLAAGLLASSLASAQTTMKINISTAQNSHQGIAIDTFAKEVEKRTNGRYEVQVFPASSLGKETDINQGLTLGTVDMIISGPSFAARSYPRIGIAYYPFIFRDGDHVLAFSKSDLFKEMAEEYRM